MGSRQKFRNVHVVLCRSPVLAAIRKATLCRVRHPGMVVSDESGTVSGSRFVRPTPHINGRRIFPPVDRLDGHQDTDLRCDLDQDATSHKTRLRPTRPDTVALFH